MYKELRMNKKTKKKASQSGNILVTVLEELENEVEYFSLCHGHTDDESYCCCGAEHAVPIDKIRDIINNYLK